MEMKKVNNKGLTLIETIAAIAILSIASLMLYSGYATVIRFIDHGNRIKNSSDLLFSVVQGSSESEDVQQETSKITYQIQSIDTSIDVSADVSVFQTKEGRILLKKLQTAESKTLEESDEYIQFKQSVSALIHDIELAKKQVLQYQSYNKIWIDFAKTHEMIYFPTSLLPKSYQDKLADKTVSVIPYFPWEIRNGKIEHGALLIVGSLQEKYITDNSVKEEYIHLVYDYENDRWYYQDKDLYLLSYHNQMNNNGLMNIQTQQAIISWESFRNIIQKPENGWKVLDLKSEYNKYKDSYWKEVE